MALTDEYRNSVRQTIQEMVSLTNGDVVITIEGDATFLGSNGQLHNDYGPAVEYTDNYVEWWIRGVEITDKVTEWLKTTSLPHYSEWTNREVIIFKLRWS